MTPIELTVLIFGSMLVMMALRLPIAISMFCAGSLGYLMQAGWAPYSSFINSQAFARFAGYDLSVIPLFILMGNFATKGGISLIFAHDFKDLLLTVGIDHDAAAKLHLCDGARRGLDQDR